VKGERITTVKTGQVATWQDGNGTVHGGPAQSACTAKTDGRWICATHKMFFENQMQKDSHISTGKHLLAWYCFEHGIETP